MIEATKKDHVLEYVDFEVEQLWKIFPEYADLAKTLLILKRRYRFTIRMLPVTIPIRSEI